MNHIQAKQLVDKALPSLSPAESLVLRGIANLETSYGNWGSDPALGAGSNNMGAVTDPTYKRGSDILPNPPNQNQFLHNDSRPDKAHPGQVITYVTAFRKYATPEAGFVDLSSVALKPNVRAAIATGSLRAVSAAMFANHYFTGVQSTDKANIDSHAKRLIQCVSDIVSATREPNPFIPISQELELKATPPLVYGYQSLPQAESYSTLRFGVQGQDVKVWQAIIGVTVDGAFGPNTRSVTRRWQASHGLSDDGIVGPVTWRKALGKA